MSIKLNESLFLLQQKYLLYLEINLFFIDFNKIKNNLYSDTKVNIIISIITFLIDFNCK